MGTSIVEALLNFKLPHFLEYINRFQDDLIEKGDDYWLKDRNVQTDEFKINLNVWLKPTGIVQSNTKYAFRQAVEDWLISEWKTLSDDVKLPIDSIESKLQVLEAVKKRIQTEEHLKYLFVNSDNTPKASMRLILKQYGEDLKTCMAEKAENSQSTTFPIVCNIDATALADLFCRLSQLPVPGAKNPRTVIESQPQQLAKLLACFVFPSGPVTEATAATYVNGRRASKIYDFTFDIVLKTPKRPVKDA